MLEIILTGGQEGDAPVGEELLGEVLAYEEIQAVGGDRAFDSDAIRVYGPGESWCKFLP